MPGAALPTQLFASDQLVSTPLAPDQAMLVTARVLQGVGAALMAPNILSILGVLYTGPDRVRAISVYGMNILLGYAGLLSLGHAAFFGIGAYSVALLETKAHWPFWSALLAGCVFAVVAGYLVGLISLRTVVVNAESIW